MEELCAGIKFMNKEHKDFFCRNLLKCRELDIYHMALIYCLGIDRTVREHFENVYDLKAGEIRTEALQEGWQTSGSVRVIRLAFNLYTNGTASVDDYEDEEEKLDECRSYAVEEVCALFLAGSQTALPGILRIKKHSAIKAGEPKHCVSVDMRSI